MKLQKGIKLATLSAVALTLAACGGGKDDSAKKEAVKADALPTKVENTKEAVKDGTLQVALVAESPFKGVLNPVYYDDGYDASLMGPVVESAFGYDENFKIDDSGAATLTLDKDKKTATIKFKDNVNWSDGQPVGADDYIYTIEVIANKDYPGVRYDDEIINIVGAEEFHDGKADTISGLKKIDDKTVEITFKEISPDMKASGGGIWEAIIPKHYYQDVAVKDIGENDKTRKTPLGFGPYKVKSIVPGESVEFEANENYWKGAPKTKHIVITRVPSASIKEALKSGKYDLALSVTGEQYKELSDLDNTTILGKQELAYTYIAFNLGKWNADKGEVEMVPGRKMDNVKLRQAIGYAVDNDAIGQKFYHGLRSNASTLIPPVFKSYHDSSIEGYTYNQEKAKQLLDEAGYKDTDGDGLREDPQGKKFTITYASMAGSIGEELTNYQLQSWKDVGLDVQLLDGRLTEFNSFYEKLKAHDEKIDMYQAAWGTGTSPNPTGIYGRKAQFNYVGFASDELDKILADINSEKSFDEKFEAEAYKKFQQYMVDQAVVIPSLYRNEILPVNKRVKNVKFGHGTENDFQYNEVELTEEAPVKAGK